ncbi:MAG: hypothetical protein ACQGVC_01540 [Myxococcota bacterium]
MSHRDPDRPDLGAQDAAFVEHVAQLTRAPQPSAARRVAFQAELDRRIARGAAWDRLPVWAGGAVALLALALVLRPGGPVPGGQGPADVPVAGAPSSVEVLLSLADEYSDETTDTRLPDEYEAIASLILDG